MTVFTCEPTWDAMLTCIYQASASHLGHRNIRLQVEPISQYTLFDNYIHVDADEAKAMNVCDAINTRISPYVYRELTYASMSCDEDTLDTIYHVIILGFSLGPDILQMTQYKDVMRFQEIRTRLSKEICRFKEVVRFHKVRDSLFVAHIEPKSRLILTVGAAFEDRMPSEHWMVVDDTHREAVIHPKDSPFYLRTLTEEEYFTLLETEKENDAYTDLWQVFFDTIAIKERNNPRCQKTLLPLWTRKHMVEFM